MIRRGLIGRGLISVRNFYNFNWGFFFTMMFSSITLLLEIELVVIPVSI